WLEEALVRVATAADEILDRDAVRRDRLLLHQTHALGHFAGRQAMNLLAIEQNRSTVRAHQAGERAQQRRFAASVWPENRRDLALANAGREVDHDRIGTIRQRNIFRS